MSKNETDRFFENLVLNDCWLDSEEAARYLRLSVNALRIAVYRGQIKAHRLGRRLRFRLADLEKLPVSPDC
jgi:excisionase family DNA binding protein